jgi:hypothetical protein
MIWYMIWHICQLQLGSHPVAAVQYTFTHKQYTEQHNSSLGNAFWNTLLNEGEEHVQEWRKDEEKEVGSYLEKN